MAAKPETSTNESPKLAYVVTYSRIHNDRVSRRTIVIRAHNLSDAQLEADNYCLQNNYKFIKIEKW